jgi:DNA-binding NarL/FixJ family response regulator
MGCDSKLRFRYRRGSRILLADSNPQTRQGLVRGLVEDGHQVVNVVGVTQLLFALEVLDYGSALAPDALIVDTAMGDGAALEVLLERRGAIPDAFLVLLSDQDPSTFRELGPSAVFRRPFNDEDVRTAILNRDLRPAVGRLMPHRWNLPIETN